MDDPAVEHFLIPRVSPQVFAEALKQARLAWHRFNTAPVPGSCRLFRELLAENSSQDGTLVEPGEPPTPDEHLQAMRNAWIVLERAHESEAGAVAAFEEYVDTVEDLRSLKNTAIQRGTRIARGICVAARHPVGRKSREEAAEANYRDELQYHFPELARDRGALSISPAPPSQTRTT